MKYKQILALLHSTEINFANYLNTETVVQWAILRSCNLFCWTWFHCKTKSGQFKNWLQMYKGLFKDI